MTTSKSAGVPRPLVRTNQFIIVISCIIAVTTGFYWILFLPLLAGLSGIFLGKNFVIATARHFLKKAPSDYVQEDKSDLRFNQIIASSLLALSLLAHFTGFSVLAIVAASIVFLAADIAISGFCVGCWLHFQIHQWQYRRKLKKSKKRVCSRKPFLFLIIHVFDQKIAQPHQNKTHWNQHNPRSQQLIWRGIPY